MWRKLIRLSFSGLLIFIMAGQAFEIQASPPGDCDELNPDCGSDGSGFFLDPETLAQVGKAIGRSFYCWFSDCISKEMKEALRQEARKVSGVVSNNVKEREDAQAEQESLRDQQREAIQLKEAAESNARSKGLQLVKGAWSSNIAALTRDLNRAAERVEIEPSNAKWPEWASPEPVADFTHHVDFDNFQTPKGTPEWENLATARRYHRAAEQQQMVENNAILQNADLTILMADMSYAGGDAQTGDDLLEDAYSLIDSVFISSSDVSARGATFIHGAAKGALGMPFQPIEGHADSFYRGEALGTILILPSEPEETSSEDISRMIYEWTVLQEPRPVYEESIDVSLIALKALPNHLSRATIAILGKLIQLPTYTSIDPESEQARATRTAMRSAISDLEKKLTFDYGGVEEQEIGALYELAYDTLDLIFSGYGVAKTAIKGARVRYEWFEEALERIKGRPKSPGATGNGGIVATGSEMGSVVKLEHGLPQQIYEPIIDGVRVRVGPAYRTFEDALQAANDGHVLEVIVRQRNGKVIASWWEASQRGLPSKLGHTEQKALSRINLGTDVEIELRGWHPPCPYGGGCMNSLELMAEQSGASIIYRRLDARNTSSIYTFGE